MAFVSHKSEGSFVPSPSLSPSIFFVTSFSNQPTSRMCWQADRYSALSPSRKTEREFSIHSPSRGGSSLKDKGQKVASFEDRKKNNNHTDYCVIFGLGEEPEPQLLVHVGLMARLGVKAWLKSPIPGSKWVARTNTVIEDEDINLSEHSIKCTI